MTSECGYFMGGIITGSAITFLLLLAFMGVVIQMWRDAHND